MEAGPPIFLEESASMSIEALRHGMSILQNDCAPSTRSMSSPIFFLNAIKSWTRPVSLSIWLLANAFLLWFSFLGSNVAGSARAGWLPSFYVSFPNEFSARFSASVTPEVQIMEALSAPSMRRMRSSASNILRLEISAYFVPPWGLYGISPQSCANHSASLGWGNAEAASSKKTGGAPALTGAPPGNVLDCEVTLAHHLISSGIAFFFSAAFAALFLLISSWSFAISSGLLFR